MESSLCFYYISYLTFFGNLEAGVAWWIIMINFEL